MKVIMISEHRLDEIIDVIMGSLKAKQSKVSGPDGQFGVTQVDMLPSDAVMWELECLRNKIKEGSV